MRQHQILKSIWLIKVSISVYEILILSLISVIFLGEEKISTGIKLIWPDMSSKINRNYAMTSMPLKSVSALYMLCGGCLAHSTKMWKTKQFVVLWRRQRFQALLSSSLLLLRIITCTHSSSLHLPIRLSVVCASFYVWFNHSHNMIDRCMSTAYAFGRHIRIQFCHYDVWCGAYGAVAFWYSRYEQCCRGASTIDCLSFDKCSSKCPKTNKRRE